MVLLNISIRLTESRNFQLECYWNVEHVIAGFYYCMFRFALHNVSHTHLHSSFSNIEHLSNTVLQNTTKMDPRNEEAVERRDGAPLMKHEETIKVQFYLGIS